MKKKNVLLNVYITSLFSLKIASIIKTLDYEDNFVALDSDEILSFIRSDCEARYSFEEEVDWSDDSLNLKKPKVYIEYNKKVEAVSFWRSHKKKKCKSFSQVVNRYKYVPNERGLYRWESQTKECRSRIDKLHEI